MFTGIVEEVGTIDAVASHGLTIAGDSVMGALTVSDSIAVNGACLTVVSRSEGTFTVDLTEETLARTNLCHLVDGDLVNLERPLTPESRMGGHIVQGHVDGVGEVLKFQGQEVDKVLEVRVPEELARYVVEKGFIAVDGISLTITEVHESRFSVAVIPYTMDNTVLRTRKRGDVVNIEVDILAKYVERLVSFQGYSKD
jgi:riboflavin synthase